ncbi:hypothetical protein [Maribacter halichondriae]|uniref:hypothetical protein n=1 Tax=Maribacter halichondriae TaxID=2980554 RepID=UPI002358C727|nr:hypothetical protein [Maribacter sp. Hal144]
MRATAQLQDLSSDSCKHVIVRNLSRILDIRILDIDVENRTVSFVYDSVLALEKAKRELWRIGFPVLHCLCQEPNLGRHRNMSDTSSVLAN